MSQAERNNARYERLLEAVRKATLGLSSDHHTVWLAIEDYEVLREHMWRNARFHTAPDGPAKDIMLYGFYVKGIDSVPVDEPECRPNFMGWPVRYEGLGRKVRAWKPDDAIDTWEDQFPKKVEGHFPDAEPHMAWYERTEKEHRAFLDEHDGEECCRKCGCPKAWGKHNCELRQAQNAMFKAFWEPNPRFWSLKIDPGYAAILAFTTALWGIMFFGFLATGLREGWL